MANTLKFGNGEWYGKKDTILAYNDENSNYKPLPFDFTRASSATVVNKAGLIETVGSGEPRIDFNNDANGALLLEPSRTNKVSTSNDFDGSGWLASSLTATDNQVVSPDGILNASKLEMTGNGSLRNQTEASFNNGYAYSIFVKKGNSRYVTIRSAFFTQSIIVGFDLDTLSAQTNGKIEDYGNDWYRLSISKNISGDADKSGYFYLYLPDSLGAQTSVSGSYVYAYGGQIEEGSYATSYIPTSGQSGGVTRVADACFKEDINTTIINSSYPFSMYAESTYVGGNPHVLSFSKKVVPNNYYVITISGNNEVLLDARANGSTELIQSGVTLVDGQKFKAAITMESATSGKICVNGNTVVSKTNFSNQAVNNEINDLLLGQLRVVTDTGNRLPVTDARLYNTALTDSELQQLTTI